MSISTTLKHSEFSLIVPKKTLSITHNDDVSRIQSFINQLTIKEAKTLVIAYEQLETSFDIEKSILYQKWSRLNSM